jgi:hypothetical protein
MAKRWLPLLTEMAPRTGISLLQLSIDPLEKAEPDALHLPDFAHQRAYRVTATPTLLLVSPEGEVQWAQYGFLDQRRYEELREAATACTSSLSPHPVSSKQVPHPRDIGSRLDAVG